MPIVVRRGRPVVEPRSRLLRFERPSAGADAAAAIGVTFPESEPRRELARLALDLVVRTAEPPDLPSRWTTWAFRREVDRTRDQLAPIRSRSALLSSYSREASVAASRGSVEAGLPAGPVRVAYAIRWLELGDGRARPAWALFVAGPVALVAQAIAASGRSGPDQTKGEITT